jgi:hypothetical protein
VGHIRRYDPDDLLAILEEHAFVLDQSASFGMQPRSRWLLDFALWGLTHRRVQAMRSYNRLFLPLGLLLQRRLEWAPGLIDVAKVDEVLLVCRRGGLSSVPRTASRRAQSGTPAAKTDDEPAANSAASDTLLALAVTPSWGEVSRRKKRLLPVEAARRAGVARRDPSGNRVNDSPMGGSDRVDWTFAVFVQGCVGFRKSRIRLVRGKDASIRGLVWRSYRSS